MEASAWSPLRVGTFRRVWTAGLLSNIGTFMQAVGASWVLTELTTSPALVGALQTATALPAFALALVAGALADVVDRRRLLIAAQLWMMLVAGGLGVVVLLGGATPAVLLGATALLGIGSALMLPSWAALTPSLVPPEELRPAVALNAVSINVAQAAGPALAGLLITAFAAGWVFVANAVSFLAVIAALAVWRRTAPPATLPAERLWDAVRGGVGYVRNEPRLQRLIVRTAAFFLPAGALAALLPLVARERLGAGAGEFGLLFAAQGVGALLGALLLPRLAARAGPERLLPAMAVLYAAAMASLAVVRSLPAAGLVMVAAGVAGLVTMSLLNVAAQTGLPGWVRGRGLAFYLLTFQGGLAVGGLVWGAAGALLGLPATLVVAAAALAVAGLLAARVPIGGPAVDRPHTWPAHEVGTPPAPGAGPVHVRVHYDVDPADAASFAVAMRPVRHLRLRDGAFGWTLAADLRDPTRVVESYLCATWADYLRHRTRTTEADLAPLRAAVAFHRGGEPPAVARAIALDALHAGPADPPTDRPTEPIPRSTP